MAGTHLSEEPQQARSPDCGSLTVRMEARRKVWRDVGDGLSKRPRLRGLDKHRPSHGSIAALHLGWQSPLGGGIDSNTQSQPVLPTEISGHAAVLFVTGGTGNVYAYDALNGGLLWTRNLGREAFTCGFGTWYMGVGGSVAYDPQSRPLYAVGNANTAQNAFARNVLFHIVAATRQVLR
jgi:outer membrane protein assembly factor BamB